jgi:hypothetical protein
MPGSGETSAAGGSDRRKYILFLSDERAWS